MDGGGFSGGAAFDVGRYVVAPFLWQQKVRALDAVILTHPEADHMKGLLFVLENFRIGCLSKTGMSQLKKIYGGFWPFAGIKTFLCGFRIVKRTGLFMIAPNCFFSVRHVAAGFFRK